jgi:hypothetical protein
MRTVIARWEQLIHVRDAVSECRRIWVRVCFWGSAVPWTKNRYPVSMKNLLPPVREKAILIANALLEEGHPEGQCIRIAIARAQDWAARRGIDHERARTSLLH